MNFKNKTIWITGASSGIGEALAYALSKEGARLILSARNASALQKVRQNCLAHCEVVSVQPLDLENHEELPLVAAKVLAQFPKIDILIHNAGISQRSLAKDTQTAVDKRLMDINYHGTIILTKAVLPSMLLHRLGHFVVITSLVGVFGTPMRSAYSASKHALHGFFEALRAELVAYNIKVSIICPGFIKTNVSINALTADGSPQNQMDEGQAKGMSAERFAKKCLRAIDQEKLETYIGGKETWAVYLKRFFPKYFAKLLAKAKVT